MNEAMESLLSGADKEEIHRSLQSAQLDLKQASDECYQQQVLVEVSEGTYKLRPTRLEIGAALQSACKHAVISSIRDACWVLVDMTLVQHVLNNAQSNGLQFGDRTGRHPLQLAYSLEFSTQGGTQRQAIVTLRLTNVAGTSQPSLIKLADANGCISMEDIKKMRNWGSDGRGLGTDIVIQSAQLLNAAAHLEVTDFATTFVMRVPVQICDAPMASPQLHQIAPLHATVKLSHVVVIQAHFGPVQKRTLYLEMEKLGFASVTLFGDSAESIIQAPLKILAAEHPPQTIFVERYLNVPGLDDAQTNGLNIIRTLSDDTRVSGMLMMINVPEDDSVEYKEPHHSIQRDVPLAEAFHTSWVEFSSTRPIHSCRVCIVDDCPIVVQMLRRRLWKAGASVSLVESGDQFLAKGTKSAFPWDVVVLDFTMPGRNGLETLQEIPHHVKTRLTVIMHTSEPGAGMLEEFSAAGALTCIPKKPSASKEILALVESVYAYGPS